MWLQHNTDLLVCRSLELLETSTLRSALLPAAANCAVEKIALKAPYKVTLSDKLQLGWLRVGYRYVNTSPIPFYASRIKPCSSCLPHAFCLLATFQNRVSFNHAKPFPQMYSRSTIPASRERRVDPRASIFLTSNSLCL